MRIIARLPAAEPAAAWIRGSLDIARRGVVVVWSRSKVGIPADPAPASQGVRS